MRNAEFEAGKAAREAAIAAGGSPYSTPMQSAVPDAGGGTTYDKWIMMGNHPSGATATKITPLLGETRVYAGKKNIGVLSETSKAIHHIQTHTDNRRQGVATQMLRTSNFVRGRDGRDAPLVHGDVRTPSGDAWAKSVGGELPPKIPSFGTTVSMLEDIK
jgi:hypothetical protein